MKKARFNVAAATLPRGDPLQIGRLYGRRQGHKLREGQQTLLDDLLPKVSVPIGAGLAAPEPLDAASLFGRPCPLEVEIGFGSGEHLAERAASHPDLGFVGAEPFLNGVVAALGHIQALGLTNVRLHMGDALGLLDRFADASLDRVCLLHPDPWPKARHAKRRLMNRGPVDLIAAKLRPGGEFRFATDHPIYVTHALMVMRERRDFLWLADTPDDFLLRPSDWPETRYARKARAVGHEIWYFRWQRQ